MHALVLHVPRDVALRVFLMSVKRVLEVVPVFFFGLRLGFRMLPPPTLPVTLEEDDPRVVVRRVNEPFAPIVQIIVSHSRKRKVFNGKLG